MNNNNIPNSSSIVSKEWTFCNILRDDIKKTRLSVADKMEESITQSLQKSESLRQSILKKAFCGELVA